MSAPPDTDPRVTMQPLRAIREGLRRQAERLNNHPRIRNFTLWGFAGAVLLYVLRLRFDSQVDGMVLAAWRSIAALPAQPVGWVYAAVAVWIAILAVVLSVWVAVDARRQVATRASADVHAEREAARVHLEAVFKERDKAIAELAQHVTAMQCGTVQWNAQRLSEADLAILTAKVRALRPFLLEAQSSGKVLMYKVMHGMWELGDSDSRFWLSSFLNDFVAKRAQNALGELWEASDEGRDSREPVALFLQAYWENVQWMGRICRLFLNRPLDDFEGFAEWRERDAQMHDELKTCLVAPQLGDVQRWIEGTKRVPTAETVARITRPAMEL